MNTLLSLLLLWCQDVALQPLGLPASRVLRVHRRWAVAGVSSLSLSVRDRTLPGNDQYPSSLQVFCSRFHGDREASGLAAQVRISPEPHVTGCLNSAHFYLFSGAEIKHFILPSSGDHCSGSFHINNTCSVFLVFNPLPPLSIAGTFPPASCIFSEVMNLAAFVGTFMFFCGDLFSAAD